MATKQSQLYKLINMPENSIWAILKAKNKTVVFTPPPEYITLNTQYMLGHKHIENNQLYATILFSQ